MTSLDVRLIPILDDNYVFFIVRADSKSCVVVDPGEAQPVLDFLVKQNLILEAILLTHHHPDHTGGVLALKERFKIPVYAPLKNKLQIPYATDYVVEGQKLSLINGHLELNTFELPGHTLGHVAYFESYNNWLFSGDVLFGLGCGRLFEGTFAQAYESLKRIKNLPHETLVFCTHEYTEANLRFCKSLTAVESPAFSKRASELSAYEQLLIQKRNANLPSVPLNLGVEKEVNPFLLAENIEQFTFIRDLKNRR
jgi:hydroxyacylglutathione hydrolase